MDIAKIKNRCSEIFGGIGQLRVEVWNSIFAMVHGLFFMLPFQTFETLPTNSLLQINNKFYYGLILLLVGIIKFCFLYTANLNGRKITAAILAVIWVTIFSQLLLFAPQSPTLAASLVLWVMSATTFWRL
jgi:hypothetical protein